ncbi:MAG: class I SAM-dependent methyltransferase [Actinobacteria bacterium]|nr:class I SAM-dependent methyltransferase [Actinomycetota bacterium]
MLDLGCGIGRVARYVAPRCELLWAVDASEQMLTMARRRLGDLPNVRYERCLDNAVPVVPDASVDLAYSVLVLQHLEREDAFQLLRDLRRMVRPGGVAWLTFPNLLSDEYLSAFLAYVDQGQMANRCRARFYTPQEVERLLPAAGFEVEELDAGVEIKVVAR